MRYPGLLNISNKPGAAITANDIANVVAVLEEDPRVAEIAPAGSAISIKAHFDNEDLEGVYSVGRIVNAANFEPAPQRAKPCFDDLVGQHGEIRIDLISSGKTFQIIMHKDLNRSNRLKEIAGARWHPDSTAWRVSATRHADLRRWLDGEVNKQETTAVEAALAEQRAREEELARMAAVAEQRARQEQEQAGIRAAAQAKAKALAERPVMDDMLTKLAAANEFELVEGKVITGVGGRRPTAVAIDLVTGVQVDATPLLRITQEQSSRRVTLFHVHAPKVDGVVLKVRYWWNRDRVAEVSK